MFCFWSSVVHAWHAIVIIIIISDGRCTFATAPLGRSVDVLDLTDGCATPEGSSLLHGGLDGDDGDDDDADDWGEESGSCRCGKEDRRTTCTRSATVANTRVLTPTSRSG